MNLKKDMGLAGMDMIIAMIAITIFSTLILTLMYNNAMENVKLKQENLAMIYLTETFENIGIENYDNIIIGEYLDIGKNDYPSEIENLVSDNAKNNFIVDMSITNLFSENENYEEFIKKIKVTITYIAGNKSYTCSMERMKIKE